eukprot:UN14988
MNCATILNHVVGFQGELSEILQKRRSNKDNVDKRKSEKMSMKRSKIKKQLGPINR